MTKQKDSTEKAMRDIRWATRRQYSAEEKIRIVLEGLLGESILALSLGRTADPGSGRVRLWTTNTSYWKVVACLKRQIRGV